MDATQISIEQLQEQLGLTDEQLSGQGDFELPPMELNSPLLDSGATPDDLENFNPEVIDLDAINSIHFDGGLIDYASSFEQIGLNVEQALTSAQQTEASAEEEYGQLLNPIFDFLKSFEPAPLEQAPLERTLLEQATSPVFYNTATPGHPVVSSPAPTMATTIPTPHSPQLAVVPNWSPFEQAPAQFLAPPSPSVSNQIFDSSPYLQRRPDDRISFPLPTAERLQGIFPGRRVRTTEKRRQREATALTSPAAVNGFAGPPAQARHALQVDKVTHVNQTEQAQRPVRMLQQTRAQQQAQVLQAPQAAGPAVIRARFTNLEQARQSTAMLPIHKAWLPPRRDVTIPQDNVARAFYVGNLMQAFHATRECIETAETQGIEHRWAGLVNGTSPYTLDMFECVSWELVNIAEKLHNHGPAYFSARIFDPDTMRNVYTHRNLTFAECIQAMCRLLRFSKARCESLLKSEDMFKTVGFPDLLYKESQANKTAADKKRRQVADDDELQGQRELSAPGVGGENLEDGIFVPGPVVQTGAQRRTNAQQPYQSTPTLQPFAQQRLPRSAPAGSLLGVRQHHPARQDSTSDTDAPRLYVPAASVPQYGQSLLNVPNAPASTNSVRPVGPYVLTSEQARTFQESVAAFKQATNRPRASKARFPGNPPSQ